MRVRFLENGLVFIDQAIRSNPQREGTAFLKQRAQAFQEVRHHALKGAIVGRVELARSRRSREQVERPTDLLRPNVGGDGHRAVLRHVG